MTQLELHVILTVVQHHSSSRTIKVMNDVDLSTTHWCHTHTPTWTAMQCWCDFSATSI